MKELNYIQCNLVAPKGKKNGFGNYKYRSLEDICEAVKPLLHQTSCTLTFTDTIQVILERIFICSTATITNANGERESSTSYAELGEHKGMAPEQCLGTASSYARKYAASSLLCIDGNEDVDGMDNRHYGNDVFSAPAAPDAQPEPSHEEDMKVLQEIKEDVEKARMKTLLDKVKKLKTKEEVTSFYGNVKSTLNDEDRKALYEAAKERINKLA